MSFFNRLKEAYLKVYYDLGDMIHRVRTTSRVHLKGPNFIDEVTIDGEVIQLGVTYYARRGFLSRSFETHVRATNTVTGTVHEFEYTHGRTYLTPQEIQEAVILDLID